MRYEVEIHIELKHVLAIEAESPDEARQKALNSVDNLHAEHSVVNVTVDRGVN